MKKTLLTTLLIAPTLLMAQTTILSDNFDSYTAGNTIAADGSGTWDTWTGGSGTAEDADVSASQFSSALNSMNVYNAGAGSPEHDMILLFPSTYTTGTYEFRCKIYVTGNDAGYFNLGGAWTTGGTNYEYGTDVFFNSDGTGFFTNPSTNDSVFSYSKDTWTNVIVSVDVDASTFELSIDGNVEDPGNWGAPSGFGAVDVFGFGYTDGTAATQSASNFFMDDVELVQMPNVGIQELNEIELSILPNPNNGSFNLNLSNVNSSEYNLNVVDVLGNLVYSESLNITGQTTLNYDLNLANGMYYININDGITTSTQKIIIE